MDDYAEDWLRDISPGNPPDQFALLPSTHDWPVPSDYTAHLSATPRLAHFIICPSEITKDLKRKASSDSADLEKALPIIVKNFGEVRILQIGDKISAPKGRSVLPTDLHGAFHRNTRRSIVVDQTKMLVRAFRAATTFGWGCYCSPESFEDMQATLLSLLAFIDLHPKYTDSFKHTFGNSFVGDWISQYPEFDFHSRAFVLSFVFGRLDPDLKTVEGFEKSIEDAVLNGVKKAIDKYHTVPGMESLGEVIVGCTSSSEALRRLLHYISEHRSMVDVHNSETVIMVEGYDLAARIGHSSDITAGASPSHVSLAETTVDPVTRTPVVQRLILQGMSPAFMENLCLSSPVTDLSHLSGVCGLTLAQTAAHIAFWYNIDDTLDPRVQRVLSILEKTCPTYTYMSSLSKTALVYHFPRKYLKTYFTAFANDLSPSETAVRKAMASMSHASPTMPRGVFESVCTLYGQGSLFWANDVASDLLHDELEVSSEEGLCLRFSYRRTPMHTLPPNSSTREITPVHMAQVLFEEGLLTWRHDQTKNKRRYRFCNAAVKAKFIRTIVERSALKIRQVPATFREPAVTWIKDVLSAHLLKRPFMSVVYLTENVGQTAVNIITEVSLPTEGDLRGHSFMEVMTQRGKRIDTVMLILNADSEKKRAAMHFWEFKNIPIADLYEATYCRSLPSAYPILEKFMKCLDAFPASEWDATGYSDNTNDWPALPKLPLASWKPTKLKELFYWGYDDSNKTGSARRVKYSIYRTMRESNKQVWRYGLEAARDGPPSNNELPPTHHTKDFPDVGGLRDPRIQALPASARVNDHIRLGIVIVVAGRFVITKEVGKARTKREFRVTDPVES
ncbi:hypothetical protein CPB85DRAFT_1359034 [Mucidula mucida]|nr:hypothetical protein CPB85DRAFT_1359034 [Mucidula mucida]